MYDHGTSEKDMSRSSLENNMPVFVKEEWLCTICEFCVYQISWVCSCIVVLISVYSKWNSSLGLHKKTSKHSWHVFPLCRETLCTRTQPTFHDCEYRLVGAVRNPFLSCVQRHSFLAAVFWGLRVLFRV